MILQCKRNNSRKIKSSFFNVGFTENWKRCKRQIVMTWVHTEKSSSLPQSPLNQSLNQHLVPERWCSPGHVLWLYFHYNQLHLEGWLRNITVILLEESYKIKLIPHAGNTEIITVVTQQRADRQNQLNKIHQGLQSELEVKQRIKPRAALFFFEYSFTLLSPDCRDSSKQQ